MSLLWKRKWSQLAMLAISLSAFSLTACADGRSLVPNTEEAADFGDSDDPAETGVISSPLSFTTPTDELLKPGIGFDSADSALRAECAIGELKTVEYPNAEVSYLSDVAVDDLLTSISGSVSFSVKAGRFKASAASEFARSSASSKNNINMVMLARYETSRDVLDASTAMMQVTPATLGGEQAFADLCGDEAVTEVVKGGLVAISVVISAKSEADASYLHAVVRARAWKVQTAAEIFQMLRESSAQYSVQIRGTQIGGDASQLGAIIGGGTSEGAMAVRDCSGGDIVDACQTVLANAIAYGSSPDRAAEMAQRPATLSVNTKPWKFLTPIVDSDVSPEVIIARGRLSLRASQNLECQKDDEELAAYCSTVNQAILQAAGKLCFDRANDADGAQACIEASQDRWLHEQGFMLPPEVEEVAACESSTNVALGADASLSSNGWGGGTRKADVTDGATQYCDDWAHGLAFTGGPSGWAGEGCGWRQATLDLGRPQNVSSAMIYHHGDYHITASYSLEGSLDGSSWFAIPDTSTLRRDLATDTYCYGAVPTEHTFETVTLRYFRYNLNNCDMLFPTTDSHGWLYEIELAGCSPD